MFFKSYYEGVAACMSTDKKIDSAYIFYTKGKGMTIPVTLTAESIDSVCDNNNGVLISKGITCLTMKDNKMMFTVTSQGGSEVNTKSPKWADGVSVYAVALAVSGDTQDKDILLLSTNLTSKANVGAGTDIALSVVIDLNTNGGN